MTGYINTTLKILIAVIVAIFGMVGIISFFVILFNSAYFNYSYKFDTELASSFGDFFGGFVGTIFSIISVLLLIYTIHKQSSEAKKTELENHFFRMLDYHNQNVNQLKIPNIDSNKTDISEGRRGFVQFKIQINKLLKVVNEVNAENGFNLSAIEVLDISYIIFYYGIEGSWINFIIEKLDRYNNNGLLAARISDKIAGRSDLKLGRTNQTNLSTYFRNMYNSMKMIDESKYLTRREKENLIKIYRAQLSNPELYVIFFNISSRFGRKWNERKYIIKYEFLKNIPKNYCDGYDPKSYYPMVYEYEEY